MQEQFIQRTDNIQWLLGTKQQCISIAPQPPMAPFAEETLHFLDLLSRSLRSHPETRQMSDLMAFAFWCRRAHLEQLRREYVSPDQPRCGRGVCLQFASSNMPVLFAFSLAAGLLAGNACIVRLSRRETRQEQIFIEVVRSIIRESCPEFDGRVILCRYDHDAAVNRQLAMLCDVRVLWGTDASIAEIQKAGLKPGAADIVFGTRFSAAILDAAAVCATEDIDLLAKDFYNDTYLNDQNACSSPRILYWVGEADQVSRAKERFWMAVLALLKRKTYQIPASVAVEKLDAALMLAAAYPPVAISRGNESPASRGEGREASDSQQASGCHDNLIVRAQAETLRPDMWELTVPGGFFIEAEGKTAEGLFPVLDRRCQTLTCFGLDISKLEDQLKAAGVAGVDRLVSFGHALDFSLTWDGYDLIENMSRFCGS